MDGEYDEFGNYIGPELTSDGEEKYAPPPAAMGGEDDDDNDEEDAWMDNLRARDETELDGEHQPSGAMDVDGIFAPGRLVGDIQLIILHYSFIHLIHSP